MTYRPLPCLEFPTPRRGLITRYLNNMDLNTYQSLAMRTNGTKTQNEILSNAALGLTGEAGEFADTVKKILHHGHPFDDTARAHMSKEIGDVMWYVAQAATSIGKTLGEIAEENIDKLRRRYPEGFSSERSINRDMTESLTVDGEVSL
jgi:NTP pyrophosphatase (non-canonical NTP hydrolase)